LSPTRTTSWDDAAVDGDLGHELDSRAMPGIPSVTLRRGRGSGILALVLSPGTGPIVKIRSRELGIGVLRWITGVSPRSPEFADGERNPA